MTRHQENFVDFFAALNIFVYGLLFLTVYSFVMWHDPQAPAKIIRAANPPANILDARLYTQPSGLNVDISRLAYRVQSAATSTLYDLADRAAAFLRHQLNPFIHNPLTPLGRRRLFWC